MDSYSVRCIFLWKRRPDQHLDYLYEERVTIWQADGIDHAIALAEQEANSYATDGDVQFLGVSQGFALFERLAASGIEVFSLLRESALPPREYVHDFFDTGHERQTGGA